MKPLRVIARCKVDDFPLGYPMRSGSEGHPGSKLCEVHAPGVGSVGFNMIAPALAKAREYIVPVHVVSTAHVAKRRVHALLHVFQTADIHMSFIVPQHAGN